MFVEEFAGTGRIASLSVKGVVPGGVEGAVLVFDCKDGPKQKITATGAGWGVSVGGDAFDGEWRLVEYGSLLDKKR